MDAEFKDDSVAGLIVASKQGEQSCVYFVDFTMDVYSSSSAFQRWSQIENWSTGSGRFRAVKMAVLRWRPGPVFEGGRWQIFTNNGRRTSGGCCSDC